MKKVIITFAIILAATSGKSQNQEYYEAMGESLHKYAQCKSTDDFRALGNRFGLIAANESNQWLPYYYHAHCYIIMSFMEAQGSPNKDLYLDEAEKSINRIIELAPKEADVWALQGMLYTARLVVNPMERGQKYSMMSAQAVGTALGIDPANPRARLLKLQNDMGMAQFFGKDTKEFCQEAELLVKDWDNYTPKSPLHPNWGKSQAEEVVKECR